MTSLLTATFSALTTAESNSTSETFPSELNLFLIAELTFSSIAISSFNAFIVSTVSLVGGPSFSLSSNAANVSLLFANASSEARNPSSE